MTHIAIVQTLAFNLFGVATAIAIFGFSMTWNAFVRFKGWWTVVFAMLGLMIGYYAMDWNLAPGRLADAARIYDVESWKALAVFWPCFVWTALFLLCMMGKAHKESRNSGPAELRGGGHNQSL